MNVIKVSAGQETFTLCNQAFKTLHLLEMGSLMFSKCDVKVTLPRPFQLQLVGNVTFINRWEGLACKGDFYSTFPTLFIKCLISHSKFVIKKSFVLFSTPVFLN